MIKYSGRKIKESMESERSNIFELKYGAWIPGNPFYVYVGQSNIHFHDTI